MKRIITYFLLPLALSVSLGSAAVKGAPQTKAYHQTLEFQVPDIGNLEPFKQMPGYSGIPVAQFQIEKVNL